IALCRENADALGFLDRTELVLGRAEPATLQRACAGQPFDLVFADPPYAEVPPDEILALIGGAGLLRAGGRLVVEHDKRRDAPESAHGLQRTDSRRFGDTAVSFYVRAEAAPET
ncbi:MAG: RsmD family RNA methyltransferase, partial [Myxococcales bacterium]